MRIFILFLVITVMFFNAGYSKPEEVFTAAIGWNIGWTPADSITENISLSTEIFLSREFTAIIPFSYNYNANNMNIGMGARYYFVDSSLTGVFISAKVGGTISADQYYYSITVGGKQSIKPFFYEFELGTIVGYNGLFEYLNNGMIAGVKFGACF
jgi:hypothetical protein